MKQDLAQSSGRTENNSPIEEARKWNWSYMDIFYVLLKNSPLVSLLTPTSACLYLSLTCKKKLTFNTYTQTHKHRFRCDYQKCYLCTADY